MITELKGKKPDITTTIKRVYRLKDNEKNGKEYLVYNKHLEFEDLNQNIRTLDYDYCGYHPVAIGVVNRDANYKITHSEVTSIKNVFDIPWSKTEYEKLVKENNSDNTIELCIGFTHNKGKARGPISDKTYSIKSEVDFKTGTFSQLLELGRRALSTSEPSLSKLQNPVSEDPNTSEVKRERGYISPDKISYSGNYAQTTYR